MRVVLKALLLAGALALSAAAGYELGVVTQPRMGAAVTASRSHLEKAIRPPNQTMHQVDVGMAATNK
jgi:hypothetical protein